MSRKKITGTWYTYDKFVFENHQLTNCRLPNNCLWNKSMYKTSITKDDLPESFIYGRYYKRWGYIDTANVKDILYVPNKTTNHFLKDDCLLISYTGKIEKKSNDNSYWDEYENESYRIFCTEIINILKGVRQYSGIDIDEQIEQIRDKLVWLRTTYPDEFGDHYPDLDEIFSEPISRFDYHYNNEGM